MDEKVFVKNLEEIISEFPDITLNFFKEEVDNDEIILEFYKAISSEFCKKYNMSQEEFFQHYVDSAISGNLFKNYDKNKD